MNVEKCPKPAGYFSNSGRTVRHGAHWYVSFVMWL